MEVIMRKTILSTILVGLVVLSVPGRLRTQNSDKVVILSLRVGSVIDGAERERYQLFQEIKGFDRAVFLQTPEKTYYAKIMYIEPDGGRRDTTIQYSEDSLSVLAERIDHFEDLKAGKYRMGDQPAEIQLADTIRLTSYDLQEAKRLRQLAERAGEAEKDKVVILSPRVGSVIDAAERQRYELFPEIRGFDRAVFLQTPEKTYYAKVMYIEPDGARGDTTLQYSEDTLLVLAERVDHFEGLRQKTYQMGEEPAKLRVAESELGFGGGVAGQGEGADVAVVLRSGQKIEGELVSVRESSLLIATPTENIIPIRDANVSHVIVQGNSHELVGAGVGLVSGLLIGGLVAAMEIESSEREGDFGGAFRWAFGGAVVSVGLGAVAGTLVGTGIGAAASQSDIEVSLDVPAERSALKKLARYPDKEPEFLKAIR
jgi:hypothetical protein